jgi:hypothetical protein
MDQNTQNNTPSSTPMTTPSQSGSMGPLIGSIVVIVILIVGAIYFLGSKLTQKEAPPIQQTPTLSMSDSDAALESDIQNTPDVNIDTNF